MIKGEFDATAYNDSLDNSTLGPYFNDLSARREAHGAGAFRACPNPILLVFMAGKRVFAPGAGFKRVVLITSFIHRCVLGVTCNKPIRGSSPIPFKSQVRL